MKDHFDLDDYKDARTIKLFEKNLKEYQKQKENIHGHILSGFDLLCFHNNFIIYSKKYPDGAVRQRNLPEYITAQAKYNALGLLYDRRKEAEKEEKIRIETLTQENEQKYDKTQ